jgi:hypothetical protein
MPALRPVVSSPPPSEPDMRLPPHPALHEHDGRSPARAANVGHRVPAAVRQRCASVHRRPPPVRSCRCAQWTPSPCGRLSRPPRWRVTATTTTGPPPRPGGNSGRCACPGPEGPAAPPGRFPRSPSTGRQGRRPAVPRGHRRVPPQHDARPRPPEQLTSGRDGPSENEGRAPQQPIATSFGAGDGYRSFNHWCRFPYAFLPC